MDLFSVVLGFYGLYVVGRIIPLIRERFRTERSRQMIMTRPQTVARLADNRKLVQQIVERDNQDPGVYWEAQLLEPYTYFQQGEPRQRTTIAPGKMRLHREQARALEGYLRDHGSLLVYLEPEGKASAFLTPGPALLSWRSMTTGLALVFFPLLLAYWLPMPVLTVFCAILSASMLEAWMGQYYVTEIQQYLLPAPQLGNGESPAKGSEESLELLPLEAPSTPEKQEEKITERR